MPGSRCGTSARSISMPLSPRLAVSQVEQVSPAAPMSCTPTTASGCWKSSRQASSKSFSMNGSPTCTAGRSAFDSSVRSREAKAAPAEAVAARARADVENRIARAGGRAAPDLVVRSVPRQKTFTSGLPS